MGFKWGVNLVQETYIVFIIFTTFKYKHKNTGLNAKNLLSEPGMGWQPIFCENDYSSWNPTFCWVTLLPDYDDDPVFVNFLHRGVNWVAQGSKLPQQESKWGENGELTHSRPSKVTSTLSPPHSLYQSSIKMYHPSVALANYVQYCPIAFEDPGAFL